MHHSPIELHLFLEVALQSAHKLVHTFQPPLDHLGVYFLSHVHLLFRLYAGLPVMFLVVRFVGSEMEVHLISRLVLSFQDVEPFLVWSVGFQIFEAVSIGVAVEPLQQYDIIVELALADLFEGERLVDLQFFECVLDEANIAIVVLGVLGGEIQFEDVDGAGVDGVDQLGIGHSVAEALDCAILCLHLSVYPLQKFVPSHVHGDSI